MGTEIGLDFAEVAIDWSKNAMGTDHGSLFQEKDRKRLKDRDVDYERDYEPDEIKNIAASEMGFSRSLEDMLPRLDLLGFTKTRASREYSQAIEIIQEVGEFDAQGEVLDEREIMPFEEFCAFAAKYAVRKLNNKMPQVGAGRFEQRIRGRFADKALTERLPYQNPLVDSYSERSFYVSLINIIHPYSVLRILAENSTNRKTDVVWQYGPLCQAGWAAEEDFIADARRNETFLIATEGSSDIHILRHALQLLRPEISDFFRFIDVSGSHPFSGTGSLANFAVGLAKIDVHNQVVFLFDNDAEGNEACEKVKALKLPTNMRSILLPNLNAFRRFPALGPNGLKKADINGKAASIECYLDLSHSKGQEPHVLWTNYKSNSKIYQGALVDKERFMKEFLRQTVSDITAGRYDVSKITAVLNRLIEECSAIAEASLPAPRMRFW